MYQKPHAEVAAAILLSPPPSLTHTTLVTFGAVMNAEVS